MENDKELMVDILINKGSILIDTISPIKLGAITKSYVKKIIENKIDDYPIINLFFDKESKLQEPELFFDSISEMVRENSIPVVGVLLDESFVREIKSEFFNRRA